MSTDDTIKCDNKIGDSNPNSDVMPCGPSFSQAIPFLVTNVLYLFLVFGGTVFMKPLGGDFALLARPDKAGFVAGRILSLMIEYFGNWAPGYILVNLILLYSCMVLLIVLTRQIGGGPWWLGSVAAVLFMANPIKTEAVLSLVGSKDLLTGIISLLLLISYVTLSGVKNYKLRFLPVLVYAAGILLSPDVIPMFLVLGLVHATCRGGRTLLNKPLVLIFVLGGLAFLLSGSWAKPNAWSLTTLSVPLYLILYPMGMYPGNVALFHEWPVLGYACAGGLLLGVWILLWRGANALLWCGLLGAIAYRMLQGAYTVDPVTLAGGGKLIVPTALFSLAAAGIFHRMLVNPRTRYSVVKISTLLCAGAMICQVWVNWHWIQAGRWVWQFQRVAYETVARNPGQSLALLPNIDYLGTAPVRLYDSVTYHTPFSRLLPVVVVGTLSVYPPVGIEVLSYTSEKAVLRVERLAIAPNPRPRFLSRNWWKHRYHPPESTIIEFVCPVNHTFPEKYLPLPEEACNKGI